ncbi:hypothetical protein [Novosphingobium mangrovi (ex Huang et al. 2023)]|uniref:Uncharacterized protein n=1 Tax=Novosphingobium mangrovi (ex Huang et al. 2023) TaxID=2976432 RepID=A0ABT2I9D8_9SPHN|nr:hypothetical protein [Novosphingobium mangrovi (ex Huang et al. 2023)]MCT2401389.1 hypothetical protein [Novosphingobium mangrovi (ex Huang et al. 2023)]
MTKLPTILTAAAALAATAFISTADAKGTLRVRGQNGHGAAAAGQRGVAGRAAGTVVADDGTVTRTRGGGFMGANGARGASAATTSVSPDGTVNRQAGAATSGARGSASSQGAFTRNADGTTYGTRTTNATNAQTGNSYSGSTTVDNGAVSHTGTCTNAGGEVIPCR